MEENEKEEKEEVCGAVDAAGLEVWAFGGRDPSEGVLTAEV